MSGPCRRGEVFFAREPILQVEAPVIEAQILETCVLSLMNIESVVATKAARVVTPRAPTASRAG